MNFNNKTIIDNRIRSISNVLLLNASFIENLGLINGKIGIAIFFYRYARYTKNKIYERYAEELIDEICNEINITVPIDFTDGLIGIGWGIEYLVQNGFIETNTDEILEEIDHAVFCATIKEPLSIQNITSFLEFGFFYLSRLKSKESSDKNPGTIKMKQMVDYILDEYEKLFTKEMIVTDGFKLTLFQINSLLWFILNTQRMGLFPEKSNNLILQLAVFFDKKIEYISYSIDLSILIDLMNECKNQVNNSTLWTKYENLIIKVQSNYISSNVNEEQIVSDYIKSGWLPMIYNLKLIDLKQDFLERTFCIATNDENWKQRLDNLNINNMGLDNGMAGLGLALLQYREDMNN